MKPKTKPNTKPIHYSKSINGRTVLVCDTEKGVWGQDTTGIQQRVTCVNCRYLLGLTTGDELGS